LTIASEILVFESIAVGIRIPGHHLVFDNTGLLEFIDMGWGIFAHTVLVSEMVFYLKIMARNLCLMEVQ